MASSIPVVLITGGNQGIGFAIAQVLSESKKPYTILIGARNVSRGEEAVEKIKSSKTNDETTISTIQIDIASSESINDAVEKVTMDHGRLDILVNNAGISTKNGSAASRDDWLYIFQVNVFGTVEVTQAFFLLLEKSSNSKVVVMSSSMGSIGWTEAAEETPMGLALAPYSASKAAINMHLQYWKKCVPGTKFWGVDPGLCATDFGGDFTRNYGRPPKDGAAIVRQCVEGERDQFVGKVIFQENGEEGSRPW
ncbi:putative short-chain dehydrogenase [Massariosphaeria phaeospora]|uniref:Putative short-chain dehydrogenase n=1 Tax=Massariosphaeria phaeospora TaxID=100035 RepID=A0A7C8MDL1_9PLEO|nr:putative short-chain dehydrogenase [Massariosphaeria phaeospora]